MRLGWTMLQMWTDYLLYCFVLSSSMFPVHFVLFQSEYNVFFILVSDLFLWVKQGTKTDIIINLSPTAHHKHLRTLEVTYTQVWYIIGIISSIPTNFHSETIGLIWVTIDPLSELGLIWYIIGIISSPTHFCT